MAKIEENKYLPFEDIKKVDDNGNEFWYARVLQIVLGYSKWRIFTKVLDKATIACKNSGLNVTTHFAKIRKTTSKITIAGKTIERKVTDYKLSRVACYLIIQNGDTRQEAVAIMQTYIAMQTRRQELTSAYAPPEKDIQIIERKEIRKLRNSDTELMLDE